MRANLRRVGATRNAVHQLATQGSAYWQLKSVFGFPCRQLTYSAELAGRGYLRFGGQLPSFLMQLDKLETL